MKRKLRLIGQLASNLSLGLLDAGLIATAKKFAEVAVRRQFVKRLFGGEIDQSLFSRRNKVLNVVERSLASSVP